MKNKSKTDKMAQKEQKAAAKKRKNEYKRAEYVSSRDEKI